MAATPLPSPGELAVQTAEEHGIVGRLAELRALAACVATGRNALLEGPVGVGKTALARALCAAVGRGFVRVDGDGRYSEAKLVGHFDPPGVLERGYQPELFVPGPLVQALRSGAMLFINELNRMPEGVQNVLLPALDEGLVHVPHLGEVRAAPGFSVIATQNPAEFVATGQLSEALLDRFELVRLGYQDWADELAIVQRHTTGIDDDTIRDAVALARATRKDKSVRRGASVRAAVAIAELSQALGGDLAAAAALALPTRIELMEGRDQPFERVLAQLVDQAQVERREAEAAEDPQKKTL